MINGAWMINGFGTRGWLMTAISTVWTGSVDRDHDHWRMFYTAISNAGHHIFDQRIGSASSDDLHHW